MQAVQDQRWGEEEEEEGAEVRVRVSEGERQILQESFWEGELM